MLAKNEPNYPCLGLFGKTFFLPCRNTILTLVGSGGVIPIDYIHPQWLLQSVHLNTDALPDPAISRRPRDVVLQNPAIIKGKGRPKRARNKPKKNPNARNPSGFEYVEAIHSTSSRKCSICRNPGHDKRSCSVITVI